MIKEVRHIFLCTAGRCGSDFFHALLDNHDEICQLPGCVYFDEFYESIKNMTSANDIAKKFVEDYKFLFNSKFSGTERHDQLGENKDESYIFDEEKFIESFVNFYKEELKNFEGLVNSIHFAYYACSKQKIDNIKILLINLHHIERLRKIPNYDYSIIYMMRDPVANINSGVTSKIFTFQGCRFNFRLLYWYIKRIFLEIKILGKYNKKIYLIKLEDLHTKSEKVLKNFCNQFNVGFRDSLFQATYHKKKWWGDEFSKKFLNGINKDFKNNINLDYFFEKDIYFYEKVGEKVIDDLNYTTRSKKKFSFFRILLPLKIEIFVFNFWFKKRNLKQMLAFPYFYFLRIILFIYLIFDNKFKKDFEIL